jgi:hypothetical protein
MLVGFWGRLWMRRQLLLRARALSLIRLGVGDGLDEVLGSWRFGARILHAFWVTESCDVVELRVSAGQFGTVECLSTSFRGSPLSFGGHGDFVLPKFPSSCEFGELWNSWTGERGAFWPPLFYH